MPFDTTRMIPLGWSAHHARHTDTAKSALGTITDPRNGEAEPVFDPATGVWSLSDHTVLAADVPLRIQELTSERTANQADQSITSRRYLVQCPADLLDVQVGFHVTVTACTNDTHLVGQVLTVADVMSGSERFDRDLICTINQQPTPA